MEVDGSPGEVLRRWSAPELGSLCAVLYEDGTVAVSEAQGARFRPLPGQTAPVVDVAFAPSVHGLKLAVAEGAGMVRVYGHVSLSLLRLAEDEDGGENHHRWELQDEVECLDGRHQDALTCLEWCPCRGEAPMFCVGTEAGRMMVWCLQRESREWCRVFPAPSVKHLRALPASDGVQVAMLAWCPVPRRLFDAKDASGDDSGFLLASYHPELPALERVQLTRLIHDPTASAAGSSSSSSLAALKWAQSAPLLLTREAQAVVGSISVENLWWEWSNLMLSDESSGTVVELERDLSGLWRQLQ